MSLTVDGCRKKVKQTCWQSSFHWKISSNTLVASIHFTCCYYYFYPIGTREARIHKEHMIKRKFEH
uniref:Putative ovule protein n=1 Tax=Solanum chacoense TaxID=4108 RepID=A0A0V0IUM3_SOLCH